VSEITEYICCVRSHGIVLPVVIRYDFRVSSLNRNGHEVRKVQPATDENDLLVLKQGIDDFCGAEA
jgi:hypothetical protein